VLLVFCVGVYAIRFHTLPSLALLAGSVYWGGLNIALLMSFISRGWYGLRIGPRAALRLAARMGTRRQLGGFPRRSATRPR
jgi:hypothetical protein